MRVVPDISNTDPVHTTPQVIVVEPVSVIFPPLSDIGDAGVVNIPVLVVVLLASSMSVI